MKKLLREIEGEIDLNFRKRMMSFKEFCENVYDPLKLSESLHFEKKEDEEFKKTVSRRMRPKGRRD